MKFTPGCKCCGCVITDDFICICPCQPAISTPRNLYIGDGNGTHLITSSDASANWLSGDIATADDVWGKDPITGVCTNSGPSLIYSYRLFVNYPGCPGGGPPGGIWRLSLIWGVVNCSGTYHYTNLPVTAAYISESFVIDIPFTCDLSSGLTFTVPSVGVNSGLPTPGGGGSLLVLP